MKLIIREYWNKVVEEEGQPFGSKVLPDYELKSTVEYKNSGWNDIREWRNSVKERKGFIGFDESGAAKFDLGRHYGIHSYQLVSLTNEPRISANRYGVLTIIRLGDDGLSPF